MKTTNLLYALSLFSLIIFSARGMENDDNDTKKNDNDIKKNNFVPIKHQPHKEKQLSFFYKTSCFLAGKTYTNKVLDFVDEKGMLRDPGYKTRLSNNIELGILEQIAEITTINNQLQNSTIEKMLANQKNKRPHIINLKELIQIGDKNLIQIRDTNKTSAILTLKNEMDKELNYITNAIVLSFERYEQTALLVKKTNQNMQKHTIKKNFPLVT